MKAKLLVSVSFALAAGCAQLGANRPAGDAGGTAPPSASVSFLAADLDGDARITPRELELWRPADGTTRPDFQAADVNSDGVLTLDEWQAATSRPSAAAGGSVPRASAVPARPIGPGIPVGTYGR